MNHSAEKKSSRKRSQHQIKLHKSSIYLTPSRKISVDQLLSKES